MAFAEPERALAGTIGIIRSESLTRQKAARAGTSYALGEFNHFHQDSMT
jgi:hypothetical protein